ncbi:MAG TPA: DUF2336 domain-containing protein [Xanthobacteraceae bacterium]|nr:DUF2336 domain-containing protein [Xanthobacteraceae bacterium]
MIARQFQHWARSASVSERIDVARALARSYLQPHVGPEDRQTVEAALLMLLDDSSALVRHALAETLAPHRGAPPDMMLALANDRFEVAQSVLGRSPLLGDADLVEIVGYGEAWRQAAVAARRGLSAPVAAALAESGDGDACLVLVGNQEADIPGFALGRIVARLGHRTDLREALLSRADLPTAAHHALIRSVADQLSAFVVGRRWLPQERSVRLSAEASAVPAHERATADMKALMAHLRRNGHLTAGLVLRALLSGHVRLFLETVAEFSDTPISKVAALAADRTGAGLDGLFEKTGLPGGAFIAFEAALEVVRQADFIDEAAQPTALKRRIVMRVLDRCRSGGGDAETLQLLSVLRGDPVGAGEPGIAAQTG